MEEEKSHVKLKRNGIFLANSTILEQKNLFHSR